MKVEKTTTGLEVAIIGISCRLPGARNWRELWRNLINGVESIKSPNGSFKAKSGDHVNAASKIDGKEHFDPSFFGYTKWEAEALNPAHRVFHQCVWEALEDAGYPPSDTGLDASLYAGAGDDSLWKAYSSLKGDATRVDGYTKGLIANKDNIATLIAYRLNLIGPAFAVNTACSTSLSAVYLACRGLLFGESEIAIAGGVSLELQKKNGYTYAEGQIYSSDGHCRAFDRDASGTVSGEGAAVVVLKKLDRAIADNDHIYGVIKGSASNNDGKGKVGFTAPGIDGQSKCIIKAQRMANVSPDTISYVEAHGTGTRIGDPIEIEALNKAFGLTNEQQCAIGSIKSNIGHTNTAAGVVGLIKVALSLKHKMLPPSLHFNEPNPEINFKEGPFFVNKILRKWERKSTHPLRAGVSSFGIGGTNVHVVLEEAPEIEQKKSQQPLNQVVISAQTKESLSKQVIQLHSHLKSESGIDLSNLSYTLLFGRKTFDFRKNITFRDYDDLVNTLEQPQLLNDVTKADNGKTKTIFVIPDLKEENLKQIKDLYLLEKIFKENIDRGLNILEEISGQDHKNYLFPPENGVAKTTGSKYSNALMFIYNHAFSMLLVSVGVKPDYLIGQGNGEYNAACLSGLLGFKDGIRLLTKIPTSGESNLISILAVMSPEQAKHYIKDGLKISDSSENSQVIFTGDRLAIKFLREELDMDEILNRMVSDKKNKELGMEFDQLNWGDIKVPYISNFTGDFTKKNEITTKKYWLNQLPESSNFFKGIHTLEESGNELIYISIGIGNQLEKSLHGEIRNENSRILSFYKNNFTARESYLDGLGKLWEKGFRIDLKPLYNTKTLGRIPLPTYPFEEEKYTTIVDLDFENFNTNENGEKNLTMDTPISTQEQDHKIYTPLIPVEEGVSYDNILKNVIQIIEESLSIKDVKETDDFFELGGDSLKGMQFINIVKGVYNVEMTLHDFLECQTIADISAEIEKFKNSSVDENNIII